MLKSGKIRKVFQALMLTTGIVAGALVVAGVSLADPPALPDLFVQCTNGTTLGCALAGSNDKCVAVCSNSAWATCPNTDPAIIVGNTILADLYICSQDQWFVCNDSKSGTIVEGKTCGDDEKWHATVAATCGDKILNQPAEQCEKKNDWMGQWGTGCTQTCTCQSPLYIPFLPAQANCQLTCGNGTRNTGEECDSVQNCTACKCAAGYQPKSPTDNECVPINVNNCGNSSLNAGEQCDKGAHCVAATCQCESGYVSEAGTNPPGCKPAAPVELCGNGARDVGEQCDKKEGQNCNDSCQCKAGYESVNSLSVNCKAIEEEPDPTPSKKQCNDGKDNDNDKKIDYPSDPGCEKATDNSEIDPPQGAVKIISAEVFPVGFNPTMTDTKISYKISADGFITMKILDEAGVTVVTLIDNEEVDGNKLLNIPWDGTDKPDGGGKIVKPGKYFFKLTVSSAKGAAVSDTKTGDINIIYATDFEDTPPVAPPVAKTPSINNHTPKDTSGTGPDTLIYLVLPIAGYILSRKKS